MSCSCPFGGHDPSCATHGLKPGQAFEPMDRHKLPGEDARMAQERLLRESKGLPVLRKCVLCGRVGQRGFAPAGGRPFGFVCKTTTACRRRQGLPARHPWQRS